ncbi:hypothetical protein CcCBS67573_g04301 [Chytriomyces confervae]|uniref:C2H2-type domain-containing protein n=1 Tax=Chytriomyces confervae TaxID=246404 RepID=A0A507FFR8_9FUNG|nr:hypothetical protein CcCBS67573_g04301 [Chytriomyces confervae]
MFTQQQQQQFSSLSHFENGSLLESFLFDDPSPPSSNSNNNSNNMSRRSSISSECPLSPTQPIKSELYTVPIQTMHTTQLDLDWLLGSSLECLPQQQQQLSQPHLGRPKPKPAVSLSIRIPANHSLETLQQHALTTTPDTTTPTFLCSFPSPTTPTATLKQLSFSPTTTRAKPTQHQFPILDTRARNHHCSMCSNTFVRRQDLTRHQLTHTRVKKEHVCLVGCGARFARADALARHLQKGRPCV